MSEARELLPDGVLYRLKRPRDTPRDLRLRARLQVGGLLLGVLVPTVAATVLRIAEQQESLALLLGGMVVGGLIGLFITTGLVDTRWSQGTPAVLAIRPWGLEIDEERVPFDAIDTVGVSDTTFSVVGRNGRHWRFFEPGGVGPEIREAVDEFERRRTYVHPEQALEAIDRLKG